MTYRDRHGQLSRRDVEPRSIVRPNDHWYLVGWRRQRQAPRWFRWDRVQGAALTGGAVPDRDLSLFGAAPADARPAHSHAPQREKNAR
ncbi:WYL domain-containing protein [Blastococcus mobilis]|uniref:WYL domain-containing protein n=1 Tax=Blastococcus mobilis TaxID=1938746 RepID=UPI000B790EEE